MKTELISEYISHWFLTVVVILLCGGFLTSFILIAGGGWLAVYVLDAPIGALRTDIALILYGLAAFFLFHCLTRCWFLREGLTEWETMQDMHRDALARLRKRARA